MLIMIANPAPAPMALSTEDSRGFRWESAENIFGIKINSWAIQTLPEGIPEANLIKGFQGTLTREKLKK